MTRIVFVHHSVQFDWHLRPAAAKLLFQNKIPENPLFVTASRDRPGEERSIRDVMQHLCGNKGSNPGYLGCLVTPIPLSGQNIARIPVTSHKVLLQ
jgi:hypothetical protein